MAGICSSLDEALRAYYDFHTALLTLADEVTIIPFEKLIENPYETLQLIAKKSNCNLAASADEIIHSAMIYRENWDRNHGGNPLHYSLPNDEKRIRKLEILERFTCPETDHLLTLCQELQNKAFAENSADK